MNKETEKLIEFRLTKSNKAYDMAVIAAKLEDWNHVINRLQYALFYAVSASLIKLDIYAKTHNGTRTKFHSIFIKNKTFPFEAGQLYDELFNKRQDSDYADFIIMSQEDAESLIIETKELIDVIKKYIKQ